MLVLEQRKERQLREDVARLKQENQALLAEATGQIPLQHQFTQRGRGNTMVPLIELNFWG